jgi:hypothetical protein
MIIYNWGNEMSWRIGDGMLNTYTSVPAMRGGATPSRLWLPFYIILTMRFGAGYNTCQWANNGYCEEECITDNYSDCASVLSSGYTCASDFCADCGNNAGLCNAACGFTCNAYTSYCSYQSDGTDCDNLGEQTQCCTH